MPARTPRARVVPVRILTYHRVTAVARELIKSQPDETVEPITFFGELVALKHSGFHTISQTQLFRALVEGAALPSRPVMITVDDGYRDDVATILPMLRHFGDVATFYVVTGRLHEPGLLKASDVRLLDRAGMDVGAHTRHHVVLTDIPAADAQPEIRGSREDLQRILGHPVYWFAYPFGSVDEGVEAQVRKAGYLLAVTTAGGRAPSSRQLLTLPRVHVGRAVTPDQIVAIATARR